MHFSRNTNNLIAALRGLPEDDRVSLDRGTKGIDSLLEVLTQRYALDRDTPEQLLMRHWREIVGPENAHRCAPEKFDAAGNLVIAVHHPVLRRELLFRQATILGRIRSLPGCEHTRGIALRGG